MKRSRFTEEQIIGILKEQAKLYQSWREPAAGVSRAGGGSVIDPLPFPAPDDTEIRSDCASYIAAFISCWPGRAMP